ncbi:helix-turn-helix domain-containing protein [Haliangium ochraceum]|uniref:Helix-turn-helix, AraC domain protein n=1 Tax=Haliangium ochraceum (strain DSM 14365 / JCM 11303 / SMP-2) TaxID=502025 RepID=D0LLT7_HALO1|nr:helix-turn-helix domain-containing protein [Haliangium ochraceum]ACY15115.1 Helix-turn-helix, AraC domain protein [Haliangium ochraceum DSM 14365]
MAARAAFAMFLTRAPIAPLRPWVRQIWASAAPAPAARARPADARERVLPTACAHLAFRIGGAPLRTFASEDADDARTVGSAVLGGPRASAYLRDVSAPGGSVGAQLLPGATLLLFGAPAHELAERHLPLDDLWGAAAGRLRDALGEADGRPARQLELLEAALLERLPRVRAMHPAVAHALARFGQPDGDAAVARVARVARESGYSHRHFAALFRDSVGLSPKPYCRVLRMRAFVEHAARAPAAPLVELALGAGYADQSHLGRELRAIAGLTPAAYLAAAPARPYHVPLARAPASAEADRK